MFVKEVIFHKDVTSLELELIGGFGVWFWMANHNISEESERPSLPGDGVNIAVFAQVDSVAR